MNRIAIIPARGGSVRIPGKNIKVFRGKPMLAYAIEAARDSDLFDEIVVSTDNDDIAFLAGQMLSVTGIHRRETDDGTRGTQEVARQVLHDYPKATHACVIYPCSPLLMPGDLCEGFNILDGCYLEYLVSVSADPLTDAGCFYWCDAKTLRRGGKLYDEPTGVYALPPERCCDINTPEDWARAEQLFDALRRADG